MPSCPGIKIFLFLIGAFISPGIPLCDIGFVLNTGADWMSSAGVGAGAGCGSGIGCGSGAGCTAAGSG